MIYSRNINVHTITLIFKKYIFYARKHEENLKLSLVIVKQVKKNEQRTQNRK